MIALPEGFSDLQPFAERWARPTENERAAVRRAAGPEDLKTLYDAVLRRLPEILERIDKHPLGKVAGADRHLFHLALSLAEVAPHVEFYKLSPGVPFAFEETRMTGAHAATPD